jgi:hypothetical protein
MVVETKVITLGLILFVGVGIIALNDG